LANLYAALEAGVTVLDTSVGGIGGSPFAPGAGGNVATEDAAFFLSRLGVDHGVDLAAVVDTGKWLGDRLGRTLPAALQRVPRWP
jgi:isopropylmalate/homocitrate/citramalate synthase